MTSLSPNSSALSLEAMTTKGVTSICSPPSLQQWPGKISLFDIAELEDELQAMVGVPVDFHVANNMPEHLRQSIEREMVTL